MVRVLCVILCYMCLLPLNSFAKTPDINAGFIDPHDQSLGNAVFSSLGNGELLLKVTVNLPYGSHAFHIHENGICDAPDFKTAGGHYNPEGKAHGFHNPAGRHAGDLPNLFVNSDGIIIQEMHIHHLSLEQVRGKSLIIHEKSDDYLSNPSGNAGSRIACAVIK